MTAKDFLSMYEHTEIEMEELTEKVARLRSRAEKVTPGYGGEGGSPNLDADKIPRLVEAIIAEEERTSARVIEIETLRKDIETTIYAVRDNTLRTLLIMRYISGRKWESIAATMNYTFYHVVHRLHPQALKAVEIPKKYENML